MDAAAAERQLVLTLGTDGKPIDKAVDPGK